MALKNMIVRIRFKHGPLIVRPAAMAAPVVQLEAEPEAEIEAPRRPAMASGLAWLLSPIASLACALAFWRLGEDLGMTSRFVIRGGVFSHWQAWFTVAGLLQLTSSLLDRRSKSDDDSRATG